MDDKSFVKKRFYNLKNSAKSHKAKILSKT